MNGADFAYLDRTASSIKHMAIKSLKAKPLTNFMVPFAEIKEKTCRQRLAPEVINGYMAYFERLGFKTRIASESIILDFEIGNAVLTAEETKLYSSCMCQTK